MVTVEAWGIKHRLGQEKTAIGFYLSGHLFDEYSPEVRRFAKQKIANLSNSREPQMVAGIITDMRIINGQRGKVALFKLDDKSDMIEAVASADVLEQYKHLLKDDELLIVYGKVQPDRFSGGLRLNVQQVWDLVQARCRFGRYLSLTVKGASFSVKDVITAHPPAQVLTEQGSSTQGLGIRLKVLRPHATAELDLGAEGRFYPSEEALKMWQASCAEMQIVYESS